jgi:hypothetical protein
MNKSAHAGEGGGQGKSIFGSVFGSEVCMYYLYNVCRQTRMTLQHQRPTHPTGWIPFVTALWICGEQIPGGEGGHLA